MRAKLRGIRLRSGEFEKIGGDTCAGVVEMECMVHHYMRTGEKGSFVQWRLEVNKLQSRKTSTG